MGTTILSSAISERVSGGSLDLAVLAGNTCIQKAGIDKCDVDILINIGIYHDDNIMEPAMAPLIQKNMGINTDPLLKKTKFTFCFDLYNGNCGFINAIQVADGFLKSGKAKNVLIVSGDTHPSKQTDNEFPFTPLGAAVLLHHSPDDHKGFKSFHIATSPQSYHGFVGGGDVARFGSNGRNIIEIREDSDFMNLLLDFTAQSAREYVKNHTIDTNSVSFIISSLQGKGIAQGVHKAMGLNGMSRIIELHEEFGDPHTSSLALGINAIIEDGSLKENDTVLFVAAGSGLTSAFALYTA